MHERPADVPRRGGAARVVHGRPAARRRAVPRERWTGCSGATPGSATPPANAAPCWRSARWRDLLARQGNLEGAIRLEELWNELAETYTFSLLCAYSLERFSEDTHDAALRAICNQHAHVLPTERYMRVDDGARLREIAVLQQRALALETELRRRRELEESSFATHFAPRTRRAVRRAISSPR